MASRFRFCAILILFSFFALTARLFNLQVLQRDRYRALAEGQHQRVATLDAPRGGIYSQDLFPLVLDKTSYLLYGEPKKIANPQAVARPLAEVLHLDYKRTLALLSQTNLWWVKLAEGLSFDEKQQVDSLSLAGIGWQTETERFYPEGDLAKEVLGFVAQNEQGAPQGYFGLEGFYNDDLTGRAGKLLQDVGALGEPIFSGVYRKADALAGRDLILTLNRDLQFIVRQHLKDAVEKWGAKSGLVIILEPQTGAILAMSDYPKQASPSAFANPAIAEIFEPGSVMKAVTMASAINEGIVEPQTTMQDNGRVNYSGNWVDNWDGKHHGEETMIEILQHSNNIGASWVGTKLGAEKLYQYFVKFGFGKPLGVDLQGESGGLLRPWQKWRPIDLATASFGQGVSVTPLQMVSAFATIANKGVYQKPYLVKALRDGKELYPTKIAKGRQVLRKSKAEVVVEMLSQAVSGGEGKFAVLKNYKIAGKTGTAQIPVNGKYDPQKTNASFIGFLPNSRNFVMLVKLSEPQASRWASETAEPLWMELAQELIRYYGIKPDY